MFDVLGLSVSQELVYRAMLEHPDMTVDRLADHLGVPRDDACDALEVLADLALVRWDAPAGPAHVVRPGAGLMTLLAEVEADLAVQQRQVESTRAAIVALATAHDNCHRAPEGTVIEDAVSVRERLMELARTARTECLSFTTGRAQHPETMAAETSLTRLALQRGVRIRTVYQDSVRNDAGTLAHVRVMAELGSESRTTPALPLRMVIVDRQTALVPIDPDDPRHGAVELCSPGVVAALVALFELVWREATPFGAPPVHDAHGLDAPERALIRLLAGGHTDESAARRLAISVRSVQRMMTVLTERLNATSRFQAGVRAAQRGWV